MIFVYFYKPYVPFFYVAFSYVEVMITVYLLQTSYLRGNEREERMLDNFMFGEKIMNEEIACRATSETFDNLEETTYRAATGASISTGCSVSLLHHYCSKLPHDE